MPPKPYYQQDGITIYHGDCRDIMPYLDPVDLILTDPPYLHQYLWSYDIAGQAAMELLRPGCFLYAYCGAIHLPTIFFTFANYPNLKWFWLFHIRLMGSNGRIWNKHLFQMTKDVVCYTKGEPSLDRLTWCASDTTTCDQPSKKYHPWEQGILFPKKAIHTRTTRGEIVMDPFMGTGTTLRAAKDLGRKAIGIEIEEKHCQYAAERMGQMVFPNEYTKKEGGGNNNGRF